MTPKTYDAWYRTPRGAWIGEREYRLLRCLLAPPPGATLLDVGCGTGYFTRRFALDGANVTGIDRDPAMIAYARTRQAGGETYFTGDALALPFPDDAFDCCMAVTSLCFIPDQRAAIAEMLRVTRRRLVLGLLNRRSLLFLGKGRNGGRGAYRGAHWHTARAIRRLCADLPVRNLEIRSGIYLPAGGGFARLIERLVPSRLLLGGFLAVAFDVSRHP